MDVDDFDDDNDANLEDGDEPLTDDDFEEGGSWWMKEMMLGVMMGMVMLRM